MPLFVWMRKLWRNAHSLTLEIEVQQRMIVVNTLLAKETSFGFRKDKILVFGNWVECAHLEATAWILKTRNVF